jgi:vacuolar-type H+-ATPase subunit E/Vma4
VNSDAKRIKQGQEEKHDSALRHWRYNVFELFEEEKVKAENAKELMKLSLTNQIARSKQSSLISNYNAFVIVSLVPFSVNAKGHDIGYLACDP